MFDFKINGSLIVAVILSIILIKLLVIGYTSLNTAILFGFGNDANLYDNYALGLTEGASNVWPVILRELNNIGLYSRSGIRLYLVFIGFLIIPFLVAYISQYANNRAGKNVFWFVFLLLSAYPTLFYYTFDIYRDVFMLFLFFVGLWCFKSFLAIRNIMNKALWLIFLICMGWILYLFRPYLGFGFFMALLFYPFFRFSRLNIYVVSGYIISLNIFYSLGYLKRIMDYRNIFIDMAGGSNLGIVFDSSIMFIPKLIQSFLFQMCGIYYSGLASIIAFTFESIPFIVGLFFLIRNKQYADKFVDFLVIFFVAYSTVWLLGNDNLGTAVRLRMFNYISLLVACMIVYQNKRLYKNTTAIAVK